MRRLALTAKRKSSGVAAIHAARAFSDGSRLKVKLLSTDRSFVAYARRKSFDRVPSG